MAQKNQNVTMFYVFSGIELPSVQLVKRFGIFLCSTGVLLNALE